MEKVTAHTKVTKFLASHVRPTQEGKLSPSQASQASQKQAKAHQPAQQPTVRPRAPVAREGSVDGSPDAYEAPRPLWAPPRRGLRGEGPHREGPQRAQGDHDFSGNLLGIRRNSGLP